MTTTNNTTSTNRTTSQTILISTLPSEIWLDIISLIPYTPLQLLHLRLLSQRLNALITTHEKSLIRHLLRQQNENNSNSLQTNLSLFPDLKIKTYPDLHRLHTRTTGFRNLQNTITEIGEKTEELEWLAGRYEPLLHTGLLLLHRLQDIEPLAEHLKHLPYLSLSPPTSTSTSTLLPNPAYCAKIALLQSLPKTSLACLLFSLVAAVKVLRAKGPEPIGQSWCMRDAEERSEVELAMEECLLERGPAVLAGLLGIEGGAELVWAKRYGPILSILASPRIRFPITYSTSGSPLTSAYFFLGY
ncbi:hypothetical protein LTR78_003318 [Recurvomyces mirabilis]|uniref:F-box domain-containing protein n=1 Tax=Recurvomyces mirabilis TaxID=574656 RepID=A0AAE0WSP1_9PEZI|nr:hypothetical protein LTR78_003318 [Recurvomyces mirabilis]KAK5156864.1 hypothetical protein LTS14_004381 [Recurvomyces mirabilis]